VLVRLGTRYGIDPDKMLATLKATAFRGDVTNEQMAHCASWRISTAQSLDEEIYASGS